MHTLWIVENNSDRGSLAIELMGDFAVRRIASLESLVKIKAISGGGLPDAILLTVADICVNQLSAVAQKFDRTMILVNARFSMKSANPNIRIVDLPECRIEFVRMVHRLLGAKANLGTRLSFRDIELDVLAQKITLGSTRESIHVTRKEALVLKTFFENPGSCIDRDALLKVAWDGVKVTDRSIDSQICRLRKLVENFGVSITSVYGQGYILG